MPNLAIYLGYDRPAGTRQLAGTLPPLPIPGFIAGGCDRIPSKYGIPAISCLSVLLCRTATHSSCRHPYLGLPVHAYKLVAWLVKQTQTQDWEEGSRPIAWPSARHQAEFLGLSPARVKQLNRALFEAGIFVMRDNEQGKRYGRRDPETKRIIEAFGFDLSALALRYDEFVRVAAAARVERERMKGLRRRATLARRAIRQAGEELAAQGCEPKGWRLFQEEVAALAIACRGAHRSDELAMIIGGLERRKIQAEQWVRELVKPVEIDPEGLADEPQQYTPTTLTAYPNKDTVL